MLDSALGPPTNTFWDRGLNGSCLVTPMLFVKESAIAAPPETVFRFHESPGALENLIPPWEKMKVVESSGSIKPGSRVVLQGTVGGVIPVRWVAVHTEYDPPHLFADRQESGPFAAWYHRHHILDDGQGGTILRDEVDYEPPLGASVDGSATV